ncbi:MAG: OAM dimerization domain-containing protein [Bacillota bacterium]
MAIENSVDLKNIKPYGDTLNDGQMQLSFTLPVEYSEEAKEAAKQLLIKMGIKEPTVVHAEDLKIGYTFFVCYGKCSLSVDFESIEVPKVDGDLMDKYGVEDFIKENINREVKIIGACIETDAHTVGIDAIMNMKGYDGHYGLERYEKIEAINMGAQVPSEKLLAKAIEIDADAVVISQVVTQKDIHINNLTKFIELAEAEGIRDDLILICGGPRINHELAQEIGFDAGFGKGSYAEHVASFVVNQIVDRNLV